MANPAASRGTEFVVSPYIGSSALHALDIVQAVAADVVLQQQYNTVERVRPCIIAEQDMNIIDQFDELMQEFPIQE